MSLSLSFYSFIMIYLFSDFLVFILLVSELPGSFLWFLSFILSHFRYYFSFILNFPLWVLLLMFNCYWIFFSVSFFSHSFSVCFSILEVKIDISQSLIKSDSFLSHLIYWGACGRHSSFLLHSLWFLAFLFDFLLEFLPFSLCYMSVLACLLFH